MAPGNARTLGKEMDASGRPCGAGAPGPAARPGRAAPRAPHKEEGTGGWPRPRSVRAPATRGRPRSLRRGPRTRPGRRPAALRRGRARRAGEGVAGRHLARPSGASWATRAGPVPPGSENTDPARAWRKQGPRPREPAHDRARRAAHDLGHFLVAEALHAAQDHDLAEGLGQGVEGVSAARRAARAGRGRARGSGSREASASGEALDVRHRLRPPPLALVLPDVAEDGEEPAPEVLLRSGLACGGEGADIGLLDEVFGRGPVAGEREREAVEAVETSDRRPPERLLPVLARPIGPPQHDPPRSITTGDVIFVLSGRGKRRGSGGDARRPSLGSQTERSTGQGSGKLGLGRELPPRAWNIPAPHLL